MLKVMENGKKTKSVNGVPRNDWTYFFSPLSERFTYPEWLFFFLFVFFCCR